MKTRYIAIILLITSFCYAEEFKKRLFVDISNPHIRKLPIAILDFDNQGKESYTKIISEIKSTLEFDLVASGVFKLIPKKAFLVKKIDVNNFKTGNWNVLGVNSIISTSYTVISGKISIEFRLFDVATGKLKIGKRYGGSRSDAREVAHTFANEVMKYFTGELGPFTSKLAFVSDKTGNKEIYIMDYDGRNVQQITHNKSINLSPSWSPDNKKIVYTSFRRGNPDIWMVNLATRKHTRLSRRRNLNTGATWMNDGKHIIFASSGSKKNGDTDLFKMNIYTRRMKRITFSRGIDISPSISASGDKLVFVSGRVGQPHIFTMKINGSRVKRITYAGRYNSAPAWSPKGDKIAFAGWDKTHFDLFLVNADATNMERLTKFAKDNEEPSFSSDGRIIMFHSTRRGNKHKKKSDIYMINTNGLGEQIILKDFGRSTNPVWTN